MKKPGSSYTSRWIGLSLGLLFLFLLNLSLGSVPIPFDDTLHALINPFGLQQSFEATIIWSYRLPKALTAVLTGSGLALSGLLMQRLFQNALAGPFVLGISSGASLGAALFFMGSSSLALLFGSFSLFMDLGLVLCCIIGGLSTLLLIVWASMWIKDVQSLLIVGLMTGSLGSALISVLAYFSRAEELQRYAFWSFGSLGSLYWDDIAIMGILWILGLGMITFRLKGLNALLAGNEYLIPLGISFPRLKWTIIGVTAIITGSLTAYVGPIAFVGLAVPHISRLVFREVNHRVQLPSSLILGSALLLLCDSIAQLPGSSAVLPINAITSLFGAPVVIWLIVRRRKIQN